MPSRRHWLKQVGIGIAGISLAPYAGFASPAATPFPYPKEEDGPIRLSSNENPYGPSPLAQAAMGESMNRSNRYNWNTVGDLVAAIAQKNKVANENVLIAAGSTEILDMLTQSLAAPGNSFIVASPSYTGWTKTAEQLGLKKIAVPLTIDKQQDLPAMLKAIEPGTKMIYLCNPNNPTGTICERNALISFIKEATKKLAVIVDEAYLDFTNESSVCSLVAKNKNLIVVKTFSKIYGLAGARIGYAMAHADTIKQISQLRSWANGSVSVVSRAAAIASLKDEDFVKECFSKNETVRAYTIGQLKALNMDSIPSYTNFIYFSLADYQKDFFEQLKANNIQGTSIYEEKGKWTRITVGTMEEMHKFIEAIQ